MTAGEAIEKIREILLAYYEDEDHWSGYFMEQIVDILDEYDNRRISNETLL